VGPDDRSDHPGDDVVAREDGLEQLEELVEIGRVAVEHREVLDLLFRRLRGQQPEGLRARPHLPRLFDDALAHLDDRLDGEHRAEERARVADASATFQEFQRVERGEQLRAVAPVDHLVDDRLQGVAVGRPSRRGQAQVAETHRRALGVDDLHRDVAGDGRGRDLRGLHRGRQV
jgi:hypothetical protein